MENTSAKWQSFRLKYFCASKAAAAKEGLKVQKSLEHKSWVFLVHSFNLISPLEFMSDFLNLHNNLSHVIYLSTSLVQFIHTLFVGETEKTERKKNFSLLFKF